MKQKKLYVLLLLVCSVVISSTFLPAQSGDDNFGKVVGQIIDPETGKPVTEKFIVEFYDGYVEDRVTKKLNKVKTDENGRFNIQLFPMKYYVQLLPSNQHSKYSIPPFVLYLKKDRRVVVNVEKGKISYLQIKATIGGILKAFLADVNNSKFNPKEVFNHRFNIYSSIKSYQHGGVNTYGDELDDGELTIKRLHPGIYSITTIFEGLGYGELKKENIVIQGGKTTEIIINIDKDDNTGIDGTVSTSDGFKLKNAQIQFLPSHDLNGNAVVSETDNSGYYKIIGMPVGRYSIWISCGNNGKSIGIPYQNVEVEIKKNIILKFDIKLKQSKAELGE